MLFSNSLQGCGILLAVPRLCQCTGKDGASLVPYLLCKVLLLSCLSNCLSVTFFCGVILIYWFPLFYRILCLLGAYLLVGTIYRYFVLGVRSIEVLFFLGSLPLLLWLDMFLWLPSFFFLWKKRDVLRCFVFDIPSPQMIHIETLWM